jgi:general secretion pathway protein B
MSYILDALKKSDQERQRGAVPNLHTVQMPVARESRRRSRWSSLLVLALLLNAGLLVWWLRPWQPEPSGSVRQLAGNQQRGGKDPGVARDSADNHRSASSSTAGTTQEHRQENHGIPKQPAAVAQSLPPAASTPKPDRAVRASRQEPAKVETTAKTANPTVPKENPKAVQDHPPAKPRSNQGSEASAGGPPKESASSKQKPDAKQNAAKEQKPDGQERTITRLTVPPDVKDQPGVPGSPRNQDPSALQRELSEPPAASGASAHAVPGVPKASPGTQPSAAQGQPYTSPGSQAAADQGLPEARELPLPVQRELPSMSVSMVIYSDKPGDRMININGRMIREGQEVSAGVKVEQITPNGAILKFQGHRFRKGVL